jgi:hypothetical protein
MMADDKKVRTLMISIVLLFSGIGAIGIAIPTGSWEGVTLANVLITVSMIFNALSSSINPAGKRSIQISPWFAYASIALDICIYVGSLLLRSDSIRLTLLLASGIYIAGFAGIALFNYWPLVEKWRTRKQKPKHIKVARLVDDGEMETNFISPDEYQLLLDHRENKINRKF